MLLYDYFLTEKTRDNNNEIVIQPHESNVLFQICSNCPINADLRFINIYKIERLQNLFQWTNFNGTIKWDTSHITSFVGMFMYSDYNQPLDWMYIKKGARITDMFIGAKFSNKLPKTEQKLSFNEFVKRTNLTVTIDLLKNNIDISLEKWCARKANRKLIVGNKLYKDVLTWYIDQVDTVERFKLMEDSGLEIFDI